LTASGRDLRRYGSQGQQRLGLLSLLIAERDVLTDLRGDPPVLLLDDVLSELDPYRRQLLASAVGGDGQTLVSTADEAAIDALGPDVTRLPIKDGALVG
jgi:DNA replication and repair protein RecF